MLADASSPADIALPPVPPPPPIDCAVIPSESVRCVVIVVSGVLPFPAVTSTAPPSPPPPPWPPIANQPPVLPPLPPPPPIDWARMPLGTAVRTGAEAGVDGAGVREARVPGVDRANVADRYGFCSAAVAGAASQAHNTAGSASGAAGSADRLGEDRRRRRAAGLDRAVIRCADNAAGTALGATATAAVKETECAAAMAAAATDTCGKQPRREETTCGYISSVRNRCVSSGARAASGRGKCDKPGRADPICPIAPHGLRRDASREMALRGNAAARPGFNRSDSTSPCATGVVVRIGATASSLSTSSSNACRDDAACVVANCRNIEYALQNGGAGAAAIPAIAAIAEVAASAPIPAIPGMGLRKNAVGSITCGGDLERNIAIRIGGRAAQVNRSTETTGTRKTAEGAAGLDRSAAIAAVRAVGAQQQPMRARCCCTDRPASGRYGWRIGRVLHENLPTLSAIAAVPAADRTGTANPARAFSADRARLDADPGALDHHVLVNGENCDHTTDATIARTGVWVVFASGTPAVPTAAAGNADLNVWQR